MPQAPAPFKAFAVRSEEPPYAHLARAPFTGVHVLRIEVLEAEALARLVAEGRRRTPPEVFSDITYTPTQWARLELCAPSAGGLCRHLADALHQTGVLGPQPAAYAQHLRRSRVDFLNARGAGFHNDVGRHWARCLFWLLALEVAEVEFVMPHAGVRIGLSPGDMLLFDPAMAHGLCRPADAGQALAASFATGAHCCQLFLTGELRLADAQWAALGSPWLPVEEHARRRALDLAAAPFDDRTGAIQRLSAMAQCMARA